MKRLLLLVTTIILVVFAGYTVFARQQKELGEGVMMQKDEQMCPMPSCPMCAMMCKSMMDKALVATEDGGVILMVGCKLIKFDKDLNKVKEIPIEIDTKNVQNKMREMMKSCPLCPKMMRMHKGMMCMQEPEDSNNLSAVSTEQTVCPVTGKKIDKKIYTEYKGKKVYFCCPGCIEKFNDNPEKYIDKLPQFKK